MLGEEFQTQNSSTNRVTTTTSSGFAIDPPLLIAPSPSDHRSRDVMVPVESVIGDLSGKIFSENSLETPTPVSTPVRRP